MTRDLLVDVGLGFFDIVGAAIYAMGVRLAGGRSYTHMWLDSAAESNPNQKCMITGHSLGGVCAYKHGCNYNIAANHRPDIDVHVFNAGTGLGCRAAGGIVNMA